MATYKKTDFRDTRENQYHYFLKILQFSMLGIALTLIFLMMMLRFVWS
jgi:hypothetical protein